MIARSIYAESKQAVELLLKIDKVKLKNTLNRLNRNTLEIDDEGNRFSRGEFKDLIDDHLKNIQRKGAEQSLKKSDIKKNIIAKRNRPMIERSNRLNTTYSTLKNFPSFKYEQLIIWITMMSIFINIASVTNYFYLQSFYNDLEVSINASSSISVASTSVYIISSIIYSRTLKATQPISTQVGLSADQEKSLYNSMRFNIERA